MVSEDTQQRDTQQRITKKLCMACHREFTGLVASCPHDGTVLVPLQQDQLIGTKLADRYLIMSVIGHGGMGVVYKARHELMDRIVAIKMLQSQLISDSMSVKRFQQEAKAASKLKHPNVITLYDFGVSPTGQPYLVMDYLEGISLSDVIKKDGQVGVDRCIKIFAQACSALDHAHRQGVIHRDLKPGNIMLVEDDDDKDCVKVVDFGVAKLLWAGDDENQRLTQTGEVCGSPVYMSPEQCQGQKLDHRSDIYSMGVVVYEALTGRLPLLGKTMVDTMSKHISEMPQPFSVVRPDLYIPERLEAVVFKALAKDPGQRQQSMADMEQELLMAVPKPGRTTTTLRGVTSLPPGTTVELPKPAVPAAPVAPAAPVRSNAPTAIILAVLVAAAIGGGLAFMFLNKPKQQPAPSTEIRSKEPPVAAPSTVTPQAPPKPSSAPATPEAARPVTGKPETVPVAVPPAPAAPASRPVARPARPKPPAPAKQVAERSVRPSAAAQAERPTPPAQPAVDPFEQLKRERSY